MEIATTSTSHDFHTPTAPETPRHPGISVTDDGKAARFRFALGIGHLTGWPAEGTFGGLIVDKNG